MSIHEEEEEKGESIQNSKANVMNAYYMLSLDQKTEIQTKGN